MRKEFKKRKRRREEGMGEKGVKNGKALQVVKEGRKEETEEMIEGEKRSRWEE